MTKWYEDRDFPEVKISNADVLAHIPKEEERKRVISEQNALVDKLQAAEMKIALLNDEIRSAIQALFKGTKPIQFFQEGSEARALQEAVDEAHIHLHRACRV